MKAPSGSNHIEVWRPVFNHEGRYEVSDSGRVRSLVVPSKSKIKKPRKIPLILKPVPSPKGYLTARISQTTTTIHRLVLEAFVGPRPKGRECGHQNGNRADNRLVNLRWITSSENEQQKKEHGTFAPHQKKLQ